MDFMQHSCMLAEPSPVINNSRKEAIVIHQSKIIVIINRHLICASRFGRGVCTGVKRVIQVCVFAFRVSQDISNPCGIRAFLNFINVVLVSVCSNNFVSEKPTCAFRFIVVKTQNRAFNQFPRTRIPSELCCLRSCEPH